MEKLDRETQKIFGGNAPADDIAVLGSFKSGTPVYTDDIATLQNEAYEEGYGASLVANEAPFLEEQNSVPYVLSKQLAYLFQTGIPEWDENTTYYANTSFCQINGIIYKSLTDDNLGNNPVTDNENWEIWNPPSANTDLSNLTATGEKHFLNKTQITNCLLEVPQNINLQLSDGTLTAKAGCIAIFPNGFEADGTTPKFDYVSASSEKTSKPSYTRTNGIVHTGPNFNMISDFPYAYSGPTAPTTGQQYMLWYDTANNLVKRTSDSGATWASGYSLPLGLINCSSNGYTEITQVFNGMGFIGSTVWVDKGVKCLAPNYRNPDGTLNNKELQTSRLRVYNNASDITLTNSYFLLTSAGQLARYTPYTYDAKENINLQSNGTPAVMCPLVGADFSSGVVTRFSPVLPFRAADAQDLASYLPLTGGTLTNNLMISSNQPIFMAQAQQANQPGSMIAKANWLDSTVAVSAAADISLGRFRVQDKNNTEVAIFQGVRDVNIKGYSAQMRARNNITQKAFGIIVRSLDNGSVETSAPSVSNANGIVTQAALSKAANGYIKLGCGIIIQWGRETSSLTTNPKTITYPKAFSSATSYAVTANDSTSSNNQSHCGVNSPTATGFTLYHSTDAQVITWLAIGY